jgi:hypothetical protein
MICFIWTVNSFVAAPVIPEHALVWLLWLVTGHPCLVKLSANKKWLDWGQTCPWTAMCDAWEVSESQFFMQNFIPRRFDDI